MSEERLFGAAAAAQGIPALRLVRHARGRYRERLASVCRACFERDEVCHHWPELPLRVLLVGHNPSILASERGYYYGNTSMNAMMRLLRGDLAEPVPAREAADAIAAGKAFEGLIPPWFRLEDQDRMPAAVGIGFLDVSPDVGNDAAAVDLRPHRADFFARLLAHQNRCRALLGSQPEATAALDLVQSEAGRALAEGHDHASLSSLERLRTLFKRPRDHRGDDDDDAHDDDRPRGAARSTRPRLASSSDLLGAASSAPEAPASAAVQSPAILAFTGLRQFMQVFAGPGTGWSESRLLSAVRAGESSTIQNPIPAHVRPSDWPADLRCEVWVLTSTSGRASAFHARRRAEFASLSRAAAALPWPPARDK